MLDEVQHQVADPPDTTDALRGDDFGTGSEEPLEEGDKRLVFWGSASAAHVKNRIVKPGIGQAATREGSNNRGPELEVRHGETVGEVVVVADSR
jgi:hypothetical protein